MLKISQKNEKLPASYKILASSTLTPSRFLHVNGQIEKLSGAVQSVCNVLNDFEWQVKHKTRAANRECLLYKINCIWDNLALDFESIWSGEFTPLLPTLDAEFDSVMEDTRIKSLYNCGEHLRHVIAAYDRQYKVTSGMIAEANNAE